MLALVFFKIKLQWSETQTELGRSRFMTHLDLSHIRGKVVLIISEKQQVARWFSAHTLEPECPDQPGPAICQLCHIRQVTKLSVPRL